MTPITDKRIADKMEQSIKDIENVLSDVATELKLTVHITQQNSKAIERFLNTKDKDRETSHKNITELMILKNEVVDLEENHKDLKGFVWKVAGTAATGVFGIIIYLIQLSIKFSLTP